MAARRPHAAAAHVPAVITTWDQLPTAVLAQICLAVCKHGALPMAPRLACVCTSWSAAVDATPELSRLVDTAAIPARSWLQEPVGGGVRSPPSKKQQGAKGKQAAGRKGANKQLSAEQGLRLWAESGRLRELQALLLYGEGGAGCADPTEGQARDANRQLSAALLQELADSCQQLRRVSLSGAWSLRPEVSKNSTGAAGWAGRTSHEGLDVLHTKGKTHSSMPQQNMLCGAPTATLWKSCCKCVTQLCKERNKR